MKGRIARSAQRYKYSRQVLLEAKNEAGYCLFEEWVGQLEKGNTEKLGKYTKNFGIFSTTYLFIFKYLGGSE